MTYITSQNNYIVPDSPCGMRVLFYMNSLFHIKISFTLYNPPATLYEPILPYVTKF